MGNGRILKATFCIRGKEVAWLFCEACTHKEKFRSTATQQHVTVCLLIAGNCGPIVRVLRIYFRKWDHFYSLREFGDVEKDREATAATFTWD